MLALVFLGRYSTDPAWTPPTPAEKQDLEPAVKITNEQIAAEIADLTSEADRWVASAKALFLEASKLKAQADHFRRLLELRSQAEHHPGLTSYVLLGFVPENEEPPTPLCAVTWKGLTAAPRDVRILLTSNWTRALAADVFTYFNELLEAWEKMLQTQPETVLAMVADLSAGPIRTIDQGTMHEERVSILVQEKLGEVLRFPASPAQIRVEGLR